MQDYNHDNYDQFGCVNDPFTEKDDQTDYSDEINSKQVVYKVRRERAKSESEPDEERRLKEALNQAELKEVMSNDFDDNEDDFEDIFEGSGKDEDYLEEEEENN